MGLGFVQPGEEMALEELDCSPAAANERVEPLSLLWYMLGGDKRK